MPLSSDLLHLLNSRLEVGKRTKRLRARIGHSHVGRGALSGKSSSSSRKDLSHHNFQSDASVSSTSSAGKPSSSPTLPEPCALLQNIIGLYDPAEELENFPTTCGEYLELLFTHRELFSACPHAHTGCPAGLTQLAHALELRAWRADRECDSEAVAAFRHESWQVAAWLQTGGMWWARSSEA